MADGSVIINTELNNDGLNKGIGKLKSGFNKIGSIAGTALKGITVATGVATTAITGLVTASVNAYAEYEQLVGGVDTLFKNSSKKLQGYAKEAYKTAGLSANEYMSTVTSFSASLLQSLGGDTEKSAEYANQAIIDMSDNANKMGTSMESIQNAYQGFAKQNYTMLDNLKLGYGGTKTEMQRLLKDAQKISGIKYDISSFADVTQAIHVMQESMGIAGTTAKEASTTISGSINSMKSSWNNLLTGLSDGSADISTLIENFVNSVSTVGENLLPVITQTINGVGTLIQELLPQIAQQIPIIIANVLPQLIVAGVNAVNSLLKGIQQNLPVLINGAIQIITTLSQGLLDMLPQILQVGMTLLIELIKGIAQMLPELIPMAVDCIITLVETLLDNIDLIIDAGIELIMALVEGLIEALPRLIEKAPEIIEKLISAIIRNFPKIVKAGGELLGKLIAGISGSIFKLLEVAPKLIASIVNGLKNGWNEIKNIGKYLIEGLWNGISGMANWVADKVKGFASNILSNMKKALGIHSPSKEFAKLGRFSGLGFGEGFDDSLSSVYKDMERAVEYENAKLTSNLTSTHEIKVQTEDNRQTRLESIDNNKEITVNTTTNLDSKVIARETNKVNARQKLQYGYA